MIPVRPVGLRTAEALIDFGGRSAAARAFAQDQLHGAVGLHNILAEHGAAYLADEVGMGKTYVALGVIGLLRHFHPGLRVLYVVPRSNIQDKWRKELRNFVANNWRVADLRVKTLQNSPVDDLVKCDGLEDLVREVHANAHRDFVLRLPSFSMALRGDKEGWKKKRRELLKYLPWLPESLLHLHDKERFKESYARAVNAALPRFDLLVVDEAHNLRHGYEHGSTRNRLLALVLGREDPDVPFLPGGGPRVDRVLALSATPLETDYRELWRQLELLGRPHVAPELADAQTDAEAKQSATRRFMIRRLTGLQLDGRRYTKNMYRREWRSGGVEHHAEPLRTVDDRERLVVALVQKKVSDVLAELGRRSGKTFGRRFQMGMLASFESFLETAKVTREDDDPAFDQVDQTDDELEREGVDAVSVAHLARTYRKRFGQPMPHPKMNAVAESLGATLRRGEKTLVFVRRVASVRELVDRVARDYDAWLLRALTEGASPELRAAIETEFRRYVEATSIPQASGPMQSEDNPESENEDEDTLHPDEGGSDSFFAWFFRGERKLGCASGGWFRRFRVSAEREPLSVLLDENYVEWLGGPELASVTGLAAALRMEVEEVRSSLHRRAYAVFREGSRQSRFPARRVFRAYQEAAIGLLAASTYAHAEIAGIIADELGWSPEVPDAGPPGAFPTEEGVLDGQTLFTRLRAHELGSVLRVDDGDPRRTPERFREAFRRREILRELLSTSVVLGHPFVVLWRAFVRLRGTLRVRGADEPSVAALADAFLADLLAEPSGELGAREELWAIVEHFELILDVNFPEARDKPLPEIPKYLQSALSAQTPVGGMSGRINASMVKQFRMPGYPYVLVTTDVLQEGEDLHTFASRVMHYGITWTPSAMEQRTGRVDRIGSLTHRRLSDSGRPDADRFLQVQFPYLESTVELVQVREIFRRMDEFVALLHRGLGASEARASAIELASAIHSQTPVKLPSSEPLESPFDVDPGLLREDEAKSLAVDEAEVSRYDCRLAEVLEGLAERVCVEWSHERARHGRLGTAWVEGGRLVEAGAGRDGARRQPFAIGLSSFAGGLVVLQVVSPVGVVAIDDEKTIERLFRLQGSLPSAKLCAVTDGKRETYNLTVEVETPYGPAGLEVEEVVSVLTRCVVAADVVEREVLGVDEALSKFAGELRREIGDG